jgi:hypothetical protein
VTLAEWTVVTDGSGQYRLEGVPPGTYTLQVHLAGYGRHQMPVTIGPGENHRVEVALGPLPGTLKVRVVDAATGRPIEGATVSYGAVAEPPVEAEQPCADVALLVPLKRSPEYRAIRSRLSDLRPSDTWQQDGMHFFVFELRPIEADGTRPADPPVAVFAMRPDLQAPVSAVIVQPRPDDQAPEITRLGQPGTASASPTA